MSTEKPKPSGRAKGGVARARSLSHQERADVARHAAVMRWKDDLPQAVCGTEDTPLHVADITLDAYVLEDGTRLLSQGGFLAALGRSRRPNTRNPGVPPMLVGAALAPFLTPDIMEAAQPIVFRTPNGVRAYGYRAELLPKVCEVYLKARDAGPVPPSQRPAVIRADILMRAFATVGIIALVDEATGYQDIRARNALAGILEAFVDKELQAWIRTFPNDYYKELFRLRGLEYPAASVSRPKYFGMLTNDIVYRRLAPGVLDELKRVTPRDSSGRHTHKLFQRLTGNIGYPKLREHLGSVVTIMKLSGDWKDFAAKLDRLHPRFGDTLLLPLDYDDGRGL